MAGFFAMAMANEMNDWQPFRSRFDQFLLLCILMVKECSTESI